MISWVSCLSRLIVWKQLASSTDRILTVIDCCVRLVQLCIPARRNLGFLVKKIKHMVGGKSGVCGNQIPSCSEPDGSFVKVKLSSTQNLVKSNHSSAKYNQEFWNTCPCFAYCPQHICACLYLTDLFFFLSRSHIWWSQWQKQLSVAWICFLITFLPNDSSVLPLWLSQGRPGWNPSVVELFYI